MSYRPPRILLMCQDLAEVSLRAGQLDLAGWHVIAVEDHIEALAAVRRHDVDVLLLHIPVDDVAEMDLAHVLRRVASPWYLPVVVLVATPAEERHCRFLDNGADDVVSEHTSGAELIARIQALMRIKRLHDALWRSRSALHDALARERQLLAKLQADTEQLYALANTDPLTRVQNVRSFHDILAHEFKTATRYASPLSLLMLDVDHFKVVNDTHGHPCGDYVLKELAVIFKRSVRESDVVARTGGEEFSVICPQAGPDQATMFAERIRRHVSDRQFIVYGENIHATISVGTASYPADAEIVEAEMLVYFADQALLAAKETGRDRVVSVGDLDMRVRQRLRNQYLSRPGQSQADLVAASRP